MSHEAAFPVIFESFKADARECRACHEAGLLHRTDVRCAYPLFYEDAGPKPEIIAVFEAPNHDDTYNPAKRKLTCSPDTDPSGRFTVKLFAHVGVPLEKVLITNTVLCLPAAKKGKFPVTAKQKYLCRSWLRRLIDDVSPKVVIAFGGVALQALKTVARHSLNLKEHAGKLHPWYGRTLLPLYHTSMLARVSRPADQQMRDIEALRAVFAQSSDGAII